MMQRGIRLDFLTDGSFRVFEVDRPGVQVKKIGTLEWLVQNHKDKSDARIQRKDSKLGFQLWGTVDLWLDGTMLRFLLECRYQLLPNTTTQDYNDKYFSAMVRRLDECDLMNLERFVVAKAL
mmetsp:Transcript_56093/g.83500  ORF Transcript_56093/g.83500 Transcript_56093/m.83500 type:complete len:122 (+) Transcript_56093:620-985(+)